mgnify:FL=1
MNKSIVIGILFLIFSFSIISCSNISDLNKSTEAQETFPKLQIINKAQVTITAIYLEGYEFLDLSIKQNQSSVFELKDGMPGGNKNVTVSVRYRPYRFTNTAIPPILTTLDFADGKTTTLEIN